jgi:hypothetical protein
MIYTQIQHNYPYTQGQLPLKNSVNVPYLLPGLSETAQLLIFFFLFSSTPISIFFAFYGFNEY